MAVITDMRVASTTPELDLLARVNALADTIRPGGDETQELRRCPSFVIDALIDAGLFRFTIPRELGGEDATQHDDRGTRGDLGHRRLGRLERDARLGDQRNGRRGHAEGVGRRGVPRRSASDHVRRRRPGHDLVASDAHGCATHRWVAHPLYAELGKIFLGHEPPAEFAGTGGPAPSPGR